MPLPRALAALVFFTVLLAALPALASAKQPFLFLNPPSPVQSVSWSGGQSASLANAVSWSCSSFPCTSLSGSPSASAGEVVSWSCASWNGAACVAWSGSQSASLATVTSWSCASWNNNVCAAWAGAQGASAGEVVSWSCGAWNNGACAAWSGSASASLGAVTSWSCASWNNNVCAAFAGVQSTSAGEVLSWGVNPGAFNSPPSPPEILSPKGEWVDAGVLVSWNASEDSEQSAEALTYALEYAPEGGAWTALGATAAGETQWAWDTRGLADGAYAVRVRASDGLAVSAWNETALAVLHFGVNYSLPEQEAPASTAAPVSWRVGVTGKAVGVCAFEAPDEALRVRVWENGGVLVDVAGAAASWACDFFNASYALAFETPALESALGAWGQDEGVSSTLERQFVRSALRVRNPSSLSYANASAAVDCAPFACAVPAFSYPELAAFEAREENVAAEGDVLTESVRVEAGAVYSVLVDVVNAVGVAFSVAASVAFPAELSPELTDLATGEVLLFERTGSAVSWTASVSPSGDAHYALVAPRLGDGSACSENAVCASGACANGVCVWPTPTPAPTATPAPPLRATPAPTPFASASPTPAPTPSLSPLRDRDDGVSFAPEPGAASDALFGSSPSPSASAFLFPTAPPSPVSPLTGFVALAFDPWWLLAFLLLLALALFAWAWLRRVEVRKRREGGRVVVEVENRRGPLRDLVLREVLPEGVRALDASQPPEVFEALTETVLSWRLKELGAPGCWRVSYGVNSPVALDGAELSAVLGEDEELVVRSEGLPAVEEGGNQAASAVKPGDGAGVARGGGVRGKTGERVASG